MLDYDTSLFRVTCILHVSVCTPSQLRTVNIKMNDYMSSVNSASTPSTLYHTLQRHNDILQDYSQEFNRTKVLSPVCINVCMCTV